MLGVDAPAERPVLFIHGAGETAYQEDEPLASSLRQALDSSYRVVYPHMPASFEATLADWTAPIALELAALAGPVTLVGHSVGASVLLKYLLDAQPARIASVHLLAAPFWGADDFWTWPEAALPADAAAKLANLWLNRRPHQGVCCVPPRKNRVRGAWGYTARVEQFPSEIATR